MFEVKMGDLNPMVKTSNNGGLSADDFADICVFKIISVADTAPPAIKEQASFFKNRIQKVLKIYIEQAIQAENDRCVKICENGGYGDMANLLRRN
tara:strand:+ start:580 stop:864 length:285 start_codon:yes stop_codon:yes gene_type:complete